MGKMDVSYIAGGNVKWKTVWQFLKKLNMKLSDNSGHLSQRN